MPNATITLDTTKHVKIWFSRNPDNPLPLINAIRLIQHKANNPSHQLHLIAAKEILSTDGWNKLVKFCKIHSIFLHDIMEFYPGLSLLDKQLLDIALQEIHHSYGNFAAASDIIRWLKPLLMLGSYSDLDVEINFHNIPAVIEIADFLLPFECKFTKRENDTSYELPSVNSFLAFPNPENAFALEMKQMILKNYTPPILYDEKSYQNIFDLRKAMGIGARSYNTDIISRSGSIGTVLGRLCKNDWITNEDWQKLSLCYSPLFKGILMEASDKSWTSQGQSVIHKKDQNLSLSAQKIWAFWKESRSQPKDNANASRLSNGIISLSPKPGTSTHNQTY